MPVSQSRWWKFLSFFVISSCCRRRRLFPSGNKRHFIVAGAPGVGLKKVTRSRWREPKKPLEMKARPSSLSSGVCVRACRFHLLFKYPFSSLLFSKQNIPPNGRRRPSHHPCLYNVIRVYICSIHKHVTCSFFCFPEKNGRSDQDRRVLLLISVHLPFVGRHFLFKKLVPSREEEEYWRRKEGTSFLGRRIFARRTQSERGLWTQQLRMPFLARALSLFASFILSALSSPFSEEQKRFSGEEEKEDARKGSSPSHKSRRRISIRALSLSTHRNGEMWGGAAAAAT